MDAQLIEYEKSRAQIITWFGKGYQIEIVLIVHWSVSESVKETQRVTLDEIPMPELPSQSSAGR